MAVLVVYNDVPIDLQAFIVSSVVATGALVGWLIGVAASFFRKKCGEVNNQAA